jgi:NADPH2:quinone reductase
MTAPPAQSDMRAWFSEAEPGIANLSLGRAPIPEPGEGELLVKVAAAALNFSDLLMIDDLYQIRPPRPFVPGQEVAGSVASVGHGTSHAVGMRVASKVYWGGFAEYVIVRDDMAIPVPEGFGAARAAALPVVYPTAVVALTESIELRPGEWVLVHAAAGGVGLASVQVAKALGGRVIATAGSDAKCRIASEAGADLALNYRGEGWVDAVREATDGDGADIIVDPVGGAIATQSLKCIAWGGRHLIVGFSSGDIPALPANRLLLRRASAIGVYWNHERDKEMMARVTGRLAAMIAKNEIDPLIGGTYAMADLPRALEHLQDRASVGKLVLDLAGEEN